MALWNLTTLQEVDGFTMTDTYVQNRHLLDNFEANEEDVWICGFPKTGTTWAQEMLWLIVNDLDYDGAKLPVQIRVPLLELSIVRDFRPLAAKLNVELPLFRADSLKYIEEVKVKGKPMCLKSHLSFNLMPKQIRDGTKKPKIIYIARNPKDTCVSMYHFGKNFFDLDKTLEEFAQEYLDGKNPGGPQWNHVISFWNERHRSNLLILTYEEMVENLPAVLRKVIDFLEKKFTEKQLEKLAEHLSFKNMKNNPALNFNEITEILEKLGGKVKRADFVRTGKTGSSKEAFSPELNAKFDKLLSEKTKESGWRFI